MKLRIEKVPEGVKLELTTDTARKPLAVVLPPAQVEILLSLLKTAVGTDRFYFEVEL